MTDQQTLIQEAWRELCLIVQPGSREGMEAQAQAIANGPPIQPSDQAVQEMVKAKADEHVISYYGEVTSVFMAIITGLHMAEDVEQDVKDYLEREYSEFSRWCAGVFSA